MSPYLLSSLLTYANFLHSFHLMLSLFISLSVSSLCLGFQQTKKKISLFSQFSLVFSPSLPLLFCLLLLLSDLFNFSLQKKKKIHLMLFLAHLVPVSTAAFQSSRTSSRKISLSKNFQVSLPPAPNTSSSPLFSYQQLSAHLLFYLFFSFSLQSLFRVSLSLFISLFYFWSVSPQSKKHKNARSLPLFLTLSYFSSSPSVCVLTSIKRCWQFMKSKKKKEVSP
jgi:hypothetical protein